MSKGWHRESERHSLSARGIKTKVRNNFVAFGNGLDLETFEGVFEGDREFRVVAKIDGREIGFVEWLDFEDGEIYLESIFVHPEYSGSGYARRLMEEVLEYADKSNLLITLDVEPYGGEWEDLESVDFQAWLERKEFLRNYYKKFGFVQQSNDRARMFRLPNQ